MITYSYKRRQICRRYSWWHHHRALSSATASNLTRKPRFSTTLPTFSPMTKCVWVKDDILAHNHEFNYELSEHICVGGLLLIPLFILPDQVDLLLLKLPLNIRLLVDLMLVECSFELVFVYLVVHWDPVRRNRANQYGHQVWLFDHVQVSFLEFLKSELICFDQHFLRLLWS